MNSLQPGQTCEIADAYVGMIDKVLARVNVHRLTKQQQQKRLQNQAIRESDMAKHSDITCKRHEVVTYSERRCSLVTRNSGG